LSQDITVDNKRLKDYAAKKPLNPALQKTTPQVDVKTQLEKAKANMQSQSLSFAAKIGSPMPGY